LHDETVDRTTNGSGSIRELDVATIRSLDAGDGEQVPTLSEVLAVVQGKVQLLCELKGEGVEEAAVETVVTRGMEREVVFTSFDMRRIARVKRLGDRLLTGAILVDPGDEEIKRTVDIGVVGIGVYYKNLCLRVVERAMSAGIDIRAWNPDTLREQQAMIALGVNGVSTNRPDILIVATHHHP
jgi:glycerophosphoryl diester phosphodiesterase